MKKKLVGVMFLYFFCFTNILIAQNTSVTFPVNTPIDQVTGGYFSKYFENIIQRHTINGVDVLNGSCPDDYVVTGFLQPVGNVFRDKVLKGGVVKCKKTSELMLGADRLSGLLKGENRWLPMWGGEIGKEGTLLEKSILFQQKSGNLTLANETIEVDGGLSVGKMGESNSIGAGIGKRLFFEGAPLNSDLLAMYRYNRGNDQTDLRMILGDNDNSGFSSLLDRFQIGIVKNSSNVTFGDDRSTDVFQPKFSFVSDGKLGILEENPQYNLHVNGTTHLGGNVTTNGALTINNGDIIFPADKFKNGGIFVFEGGKMIAKAFEDLFTNEDNDFISAIKKAFPGLCIAKGEGQWNVCYGEDSLQRNISGSSNVAVGKSALSWNIAGNSNVAVGMDALAYNSEGDSNVAVGKSALLSNSIGDSNVAVGESALLSNTIGYTNVAVGQQALRANTTGSDNVAVGHVALFRNTTGYGNVAVGKQTLHNNTTGYTNVAVGTAALSSNTTGHDNVAIGNGALFINSEGHDNVAIGNGALYKNTGGENLAIGTSSLFNNVIGRGNIAMGWNTLRDVVENDFNIALGWASMQQFKKGSNNIAIGMSALSSGGEGNDNIAIGTMALNGQKNGSHNIAIGAHALTENQGENNISIGYSSLKKNQTGSRNVAIGDFALMDNISGSRNVAMGDTSMFKNLTGERNSAFGTTTLRDNAAGSRNSAFGDSALAYNTDGNNNSAFGVTALRDNLTGSGNTAIGDGSLGANTAGYINSALGFNSLRKNLTGSGNTAMGAYSLTHLESGDNNIAIGKLSGGISSGDNNIFIGSDTNIPTPSIDNFLNIGNWIYGHNGNIKIGGNSTGISERAKLEIFNEDGNTELQITAPTPQSSSTLWLYRRNNNGFNGWAIVGDGSTKGLGFNYDSSLGNPQKHVMFLSEEGNVGIGTTNPEQELEVKGNILANAYFYTSDERLKNNISAIEDPKNILLGLRGVRFDWKETGRRTLGLIAQEVEKVLPELVHTDEKGYKSVEYANIVAVLIEGFKSQQSEIEFLKQQIESQKSDIEFLKQEIEKLKNSQK